MIIIIREVAANCKIGGPAKIGGGQAKTNIRQSNILGIYRALDIGGPSSGDPLVRPP